MSTDAEQGDRRQEAENFKALLFEAVPALRREDRHVNVVMGPQGVDKVIIRRIIKTDERAGGAAQERST